MLPSLRPHATRHGARLATVAVALGLALAAAPAAEASFVASGSDPAGDGAHPSPANDIVGVDLAYDRRTGELRAAVRLAGGPSAETSGNLTVFAGHRTAGGCDGYPAIGFATLTDVDDARWVRLDGADRPPRDGWGDKALSRNGTVQTFGATERAFARLVPNCVVATISEPTDTANVYDAAGPFALKALPGLAVTVAAPRAAVTAGQTRSLRVTIRNPGDAPTGRLRLAVGRARGLTAKAPRTVKSIAPGKRRTVTVKATLGKRAKASTTVRVTATGPRGLRARGEATVTVRRPSTGGGGGGGGGGGMSRLCFRYTWLPPYGALVPC